MCAWTAFAYLRGPFVDLIEQPYDLFNLPDVAGQTAAISGVLRLERAAATLAASEETELGIAVATGFTSHEVFTRAFHRRFG